MSEREPDGRAVAILLHGGSSALDTPSRVEASEPSAVALRRCRSTRARVEASSPFPADRSYRAARSAIVSLLAISAI